MSAPVPSPAVLDTMVKIIMSQTDMTHECVVSELERTNYDLKCVIRDYMRGSGGSSGSSGSGNANESISATTSANQLRFSEIRKFMDKSSELYYRRKEMERIVQEKKNAAAAAAAGQESKL